MLIKKDRIPQITEAAPMGGIGTLLLDKMSLATQLPDSVGMFAKATLLPGSEVGYHVHSTDSEAYYILSGVGAYNENGVTREVRAGDLTYTPVGGGHSIKNIGVEKLEFIALILK